MGRRLADVLIFTPRFSLRGESVVGLWLAWRVWYDMHVGLTAFDTGWGVGNV